MSAFLGPIHHWLYHKIQLQEELVGDILDLAVRSGWILPSIEGLDPTAPSALPPLERSVDLGNIHGWLQDQITLSETRYARLVTELLKADPARRSALEELACAFGKKHAVPAGTSVEEAYQVFQNSLLDGMPCDHVNQITEQGERSLSWRRAQCLHSVFWDQAGGDAGVYDILRERIVAGMLAGSGLEVQTGGDGIFTLREG